jgi:caffeoyl-CoA O-methyltransferase
MADHDSRAGTRYTNPELLAYVDRVHAPADAALTRAFAVPEGIPAIQVGRNEGKLLYLLLQLVAAKKVVEVGTLIGFSAIHLARGVGRDGHVWTIEYEPRHAELARANLAAAGIADRVTVCVGAGVEVLPTLVEHGPFDAVFIDAAKEGYEHYGRWAVANLRAGGLVIADNAYVFGELLADNARGRTMRAFHEYIAANCQSVCVPTGDGLVIGVIREGDGFK